MEESCDVYPYFRILLCIVPGVVKSCDEFQVKRIIQSIL